MATIQLLFALILAVTRGYEAIEYEWNGCQPSNFVEPCKCHYYYVGYLIVQCSQNSPYLRVPNVVQTFDRFAETAINISYFKRMDFVNTDVTSFPDNMASKFTFDDINLEKNRDLEYISTKAFNDETYQNVTRLKIVNSPKLGQHTEKVFKFLDKFQNLTILLLDGLNLTLIPPQFFATTKYIDNLDLSRNGFELLEHLDLSGLSSLRFLKLEATSMTSKKLQLIPFSQLVSLKVLKIRENSLLTVLEERTFKPLLNRGVTIEVGKTPSCDYNPVRKLYSCIYPSSMICDNRSDWICKNRLNFQPYLTGYQCSSESIWEYCDRKFGPVSN